MSDAEDDYFGTRDDIGYGLGLGPAILRSLDERLAPGQAQNRARIHHQRGTAMPTKAQLEREVERHRNRLEKAEARLEALRDIPELDPFQDGAAFHFRAHTGGYDYVALRADGLWYSTGRTGPHRLTWSALVEWLLDHGVTRIRLLDPAAEEIALSELRLPEVPEQEGQVDMGHLRRDMLHLIMQRCNATRAIGDHAPHTWGIQPEHPVYWCNGKEEPTVG